MAVLQACTFAADADLIGDGGRWARATGAAPELPVKERGGAVLGAEDAAEAQVKGGPLPGRSDVSGAPLAKKNFDATPGSGLWLSCSIEMDEFGGRGRGARVEEGVAGGFLGHWRRARRSGLLLEGLGIARVEELVGAVVGVGHEVALG